MSVFPHSLSIAKRIVGEENNKKIWKQQFRTSIEMVRQGNNVVMET